jgi:hypothetical protein
MRALPVIAFGSGQSPIAVWVLRPWAIAGFKFAVSKYLQFSEMSIETCSSGVQSTPLGQ